MTNIEYLYKILHTFSIGIFTFDLGPFKDLGQVNAHFDYQYSVNDNRANVTMAIKISSDIRYRTHSLTFDFITIFLFSDCLLSIH